MRTLARAASGLGLLLTGSVLVPDLWVWEQGRRAVLASPRDATPALVVVPGASVYRDGRLSPVLKERMDAALLALRAWPQARLLLSGTSITGGYDETGAMRRYALEKGLDSTRVLLDQLGESSLETVANLVHFAPSPSQPVVLVSQSWHLPRCLWLGRARALRGLACDRDSPKAGLLQVREHLARAQNFWQQALTSP